MAAALPLNRHPLSSPVPNAGSPFDSSLSEPLSAAGDEQHNLNPPGSVTMTTMSQSEQQVRGSSKKSTLVSSSSTKHKRSKALVGSLSGSSLPQPDSAAGGQHSLDPILRDVPPCSVTMTTMSQSEQKGGSSKKSALVNSSSTKRKRPSSKDQQKNSAAAKRPKAPTHQVSDVQPDSTARGQHNLDPSGSYISGLPPLLHVLPPRPVAMGTMSHSKQQVGGSSSKSDFVGSSNGSKKGTQRTNQQKQLAAKRFKPPLTIRISSL